MADEKAVLTTPNGRRLDSRAARGRSGQSVTMSASAGEVESVQRAKPVQKLRAHTGSVLCCVASRYSPHHVVSSSEDATVSVFDLRNRNCPMRLKFFNDEPVASVSLNPGNENYAYVGAGSDIYCADFRLGSSGREVQKYRFNSDEVNQVTVNRKSTYVAASDDSGEIKICSAVQFHAQKPWEVLSGGLDCKIVKWDFSNGKDLKCLDLAVASTPASTPNVGQLCNPPFVHALAVPEGDGSGETGRLVAVARGDGAVEVYDSGFDNHKSSKRKGSKSREVASRSQSLEGTNCAKNTSEQAPGIRCHLDGQHGGHLSAVSSVTFANFGDRGRILVSGGNDKVIKLWDWMTPNDSGQPEDSNALVLEIQHGKKVNWLSTIDSSSGNLIVADTSQVLSIYHVL